MVSAVDALSIDGLPHHGQVPSEEEQALREAAEPLGAKPDTPIEEILALLEAAGADRNEPGRSATQFFPRVRKRLLDLADPREIRRETKERRHYESQQ